MLFLPILDGRLMVLRYSKCSLTDAEPRKGREFLAECGEQKITKNQLQAIPHCGYIEDCGAPAKTAKTSASSRNLYIYIYIILYMCKFSWSVVSREHVAKV